MIGTDGEKTRREIMAQPGSDTLELRRADSGQDLWAAVEAAQYARLVDHDEPRGEAEVGPIRDFVAFFADCAEEWEQKSTADQTVALQQLGARVAALEERALFVYWAVIEGRFDTEAGETVELPLAVVTISRDGGSSIAIALPGSGDVA